MSYASTNTLQSRQTPYCSAIIELLRQHGHATNADLLRWLRKTYPLVSATTVHRATTRLAKRGEIGHAPANNQGAMRYDSLATPHDHFMCQRCSMLRDVDVISEVRSLLAAKITDCAVSGRVVITGVCKHCKTETSL